MDDPELPDQIVTAVLVVSLGRLGDVYGRVRMYNLGFAVFTLGSALLGVTWMTGTSAALWLIGMRVVQGVGGAMLFANSSAILTDAFPAHQRGLALGINGAEPARRAARRPRRARRLAGRRDADLAPAAGRLAVRRVPRLQPDGAPARPARPRDAPPRAGAALTGRAFFPALMSGPFAHALNVAFTFALVACLIAAGASLLRGGRYHHDDEAALDSPRQADVDVAAWAAAASSPADA